MDKQTISVEERAKRIKLMVFDVDGVMTDGGLGLGDDGQEYKFFHSQDGLGLKLLKATGVKMGIVSGRTSNVVIKRAANIGISHIHQGIQDKLEAFEKIRNEFGFAMEECAFMGDDVIDLPPMLRCGLGITVPHAMPLVKEYAHYTTTRQAGFGAVREVCELLMKAQGTFDAQMAQFLRLD